MKKIILFSLMAFVCLSCKKEGQKCTAVSKDYEPDTPVDSLTEKYFLFKQGSYWIYNDEFNGKEDSIYVISSDKHKVSTQGKNGPGCADMYYVSFNAATVKFSDTISPLYYSLTGNRMYLEGTVFNSASFLSVENGKIQSDSIVYYPNILIDGVTNYTNVYRIKVSDTYHGLGKITKNSYFYINDSIGIVRKDLCQVDGSYHRYYLKRYAIVK